MINIMLDLETMGADPNSAIVAIGAVAFEFDKKDPLDQFYKKVTLASSVNNGGIMNPSTVLWWMNQSQSAREEIVSAETDINYALKCFTIWVDGLRGASPQNKLQIWGNGSDFDNVILHSAYRHANMPAPWQFWENRCYRTMSAMHTNTRLVRKGTHHNALDDARSQAEHLMRIMRENFL